MREEDISNIVQVENCDGDIRDIIWHGLLYFIKAIE